MNQDKTSKQISSYFSEFYLTFLSVGFIALLTTLLDAVLLQKRLHYFTGGSTEPFHLTTVPARIGYFSMAFLYDIGFYLTIIVLITMLLHSKRINSLQRLGMAGIGVLSVSLFIIIAKWEVFVYFGNKFNLPILFELNAGNWINVFQHFSPWLILSRTLPVIFIFLLIILIPFYFFKNSKRQIPPYCNKWQLLLKIGIYWGVIAMCHFPVCDNEPLRRGLVKKNSFFSINLIFSQLSDFDNDGYGPFTQPKDPNNFNKSVFPYAPDIPGNGIDENGLAGDLPVIDQEVLSLGIDEFPKNNQLNVILAVIETLRVDGVELELDGRPVAPFLKELSKKHAYTSNAYSNFGITHRAIQTMFFGNLSYGDNDRTLQDEFHRKGYKTYVVSAQDENWGKSYARVRMHKFTSYYDPRNKPKDDSSLTTFQRLKQAGHYLDGSEINEQVDKFIDDANSTPFFMYLNYQDLHFPYYNSNIEKVFIKEPRLDDQFFTPGNFEAIQRQYGNAANHLDKNIRGLFSVLEKRKILDNTVVLIIGDHPDSFFENGILGHGWSVDEYQRRTPLIVVNGRGTYDSPADQIDVPSILLHSVSSELTEPPAVFIPNNQRKVFLITGNVQNPREIAWKTMNDLATFDFITGLFQPGHKKPWYQPKDIPEVDQSSFTSLIHRWESFVLLRKEKVKENSIYP